MKLVPSYQVNSPFLHFRVVCFRIIAMNNFKCIIFDITKVHVIWCVGVIRNRTSHKERIKPHRAFEGCSQKLKRCNLVESCDWLERHWLWKSPCNFLKLNLGLFVIENNPIRLIWFLSNALEYAGTEFRLLDHTAGGTYLSEFPSHLDQSPWK